jgi:hypothetical protein
VPGGMGWSAWEALPWREDEVRRLATCGPLQGQVIAYTPIHSGERAHRTRHPLSASGMLWHVLWRGGDHAAGGGARMICCLARWQGSLPRPIGCVPFCCLPWGRRTSHELVYCMPRVGH